MTTAFAGRRVYLDTNVFIYAVEAFPKYAATCAQLLMDADCGRIHAVTSELTLAEALVAPYRKGLLEMAALYGRLIQHRPSLNVIPVSRSILLKSAELRAVSGGKLPDAIHAATADSEKCSYLITGDSALRVAPSIQLVTLDSIHNPGTW